jgi:hypothetical protein
MVFKDNTLPVGTALAFKTKAVHFIKKFNDIRVAGKDSNHEGNWDNIIGEMVYKAEVLPPNAPRICKILYTTEVPS